MGHLLLLHTNPSYASTSKSYTASWSHGKDQRGQWRLPVVSRRAAKLLRCSTSSKPELGLVAVEGRRLYGDGESGECVVRQYGWRVRRLAEDDIDEIRRAAEVQAEAFHTPVALFQDFFFQFFQAEVVAGLLYKLRNSPPNRYACLIAQPATDPSQASRKIVGIVDVTALRDEAVLRHLPGAEEYLYVSGLAVSRTFRRKKIASALLKACDALCLIWGFRYLALRVYEDDLGAQKLYNKVGYRAISGDPPWITTWIGRRCRILMIKDFP